MSDQPTTTVPAPVLGSRDPHVLVTPVCDQEAVSPPLNAIDRGQVTAVEHLRNTTQGNSVWLITLNDERSYRTRQNSHVGTMVGHFLVGRWVCLHLTQARTVIHCHADHAA